jgi:histidine ammonia-lyase
VTASNVRKLVRGSTLVDLAPEWICARGGDWQVAPETGQLVGAKSSTLQDAYSIRCVPQVHGAVRDTIEHAARVFDRELNAVTDNPVLFPRGDRVISAGNFHGMPLALALAAVKNALPVLGSIAERRINKLVDGATNDGLPLFLVENHARTHSGFMIVQYTAATLVNELATRAHAASVYSVPTSANVEDHVSMGANEARHVYEMLDDLEHILALELLTHAQALDLRLLALRGELWPAPPSGSAGAEQFRRMRKRRCSPGRGTAAALAAIRRVCPFLAEDRELRRDITHMTEMVRGDALIQSVERAAGGPLA